MTRDQANFYRNIPSGETVYEPAEMIAPITPEALHERKIAIRDGRLIVYQEQDPRRTPAGRCTGCEGKVPILRHPIGYGGSSTANDSRLPVSSTPTVPSGSYGDSVYAPVLVFTDFGSGANGSFTLNHIDVVTANGSCKVEGSDCAQAAQCGAVVAFTFVLYLIGGDGSLITPPTVQIRNPVTGQFTSPLTHDPATLKQEGGYTYCEYEFVFSISIDCDDEWIYKLSMAQLAGTFSPTPGAGSWQNQVADPQWEFFIVLGCGRCVMGTGPEPIGG